MELTTADKLQFLTTKFGELWIISREYFQSDDRTKKAFNNLAMIEAGHALDSKNFWPRYQVGFHSNIYTVNDEEFLTISHGYGNSPSEALENLWDKLYQSDPILHKSQECPEVWGKWENLSWHYIPNRDLSQYFNPGTIVTDTDTETTW